LKCYLTKKKPNKQVIAFVIQAQELINNKHKYQSLNYPLLNSLEEFFRQLSYDQHEVLKVKLKEVGDIHQLHDFFAELLVALKYHEDEPEFTLNDSGKPDIFLKKTNRYVEVKVINCSQDNRDQANLISQFSQMGIALTGTLTPYTRKKILTDIFPSIQKKLVEKIDQGIKKLGTHSGFIHIYYSVDNITPIFGLTENKDFFDLVQFLGSEISNSIQQYSREKNVCVVCEEYYQVHTKEISDNQN